MTIKQLRDWLFQNDKEDQWVMTVDAESREGTVTLGEIEQLVTSSGYQAVQVLHISKAEMEYPPWIEIDTVMPPALAAHGHYVEQAGAVGSTTGGEEAADLANRQLRFEAAKKSQVLSAVLNVLLPGAGYAYCGNIILGVLVFIAVPILVLITFGFAAIITFPVMIIDGVLCANRANKKLAAKLKL